MTPVDWKVLMSLRDDIGEEDFTDVALVFVSEMEEKLAELARDPVAADGEDFHYLRGSAANMGFAAMVSACEAAEEACLTGKPADLVAVVRAFQDAIAEAQLRLPDLKVA